MKHNRSRCSHAQWPTAAACSLANTFYLAGGIEKPDATNALNTFWSLDLTESKPHGVNCRLPRSSANVGRGGRA